MLTPWKANLYANKPLPKQLNPAPPQSVRTIQVHFFQRRTQGSRQKIAFFAPTEWLYPPLMPWLIEREKPSEKFETLAGRLALTGK